ncbi:alpha/beta fold hydrolase [Actinoplanes sp. L3-i22]|uniref:alpha/beta fold hydrolase n=1 Tax=Actinoplanes sp. L3-i22 TaxID=2836373 RepID=UPI001C752ABF|nr:alpha/beta fold hydrolase [Actinoplanes sp. L3-i22]BCY09912.1 alpha/beta hydrolase fold protein [Actinoplanes sp. L3-i22]
MTSIDNLALDDHGSTDDRAPLVLLHGLTYDRTQWQPLLRELDRIDPGRRVLAVDLPGHGESPRSATYRSGAVVDAVHDAVTAAGLRAPVLVGHSLGAVLATIYAARYPARAVLNVDQPLRPGGFEGLVKQVWPVLSGPDWRQIWDRLLGGMGIDQLPADARELVRTRTTPRPDLLLGYWEEIMSSAAGQLAAQREHELRFIAEHDIAYVYVSGSEPDPAFTTWLTELVPSARVEVLSGGGHFPHLAQPAELARICSLVAVD